MSIHAEHNHNRFSKHRGAAFHILSRLAFYSGDGYTAHPAVRTIAEAVHYSERHVQRLLHWMTQPSAQVPEPELAIDYQAGPHGCNIFRLLLIEKVRPRPEAAGGDILAKRGDMGEAQASSGGSKERKSFGKKKEHSEAYEEERARRQEANRQRRDAAWRQDFEAAIRTADAERDEAADLLARYAELPGPQQAALKAEAEAEVIAQAGGKRTPFTDSVQAIRAKLVDIIRGLGGLAYFAALT
jgi:hypothetical protein